MLVQEHMYVAGGDQQWLCETVFRVSSKSGVGDGAGVSVCQTLDEYESVEDSQGVSYFARQVWVRLTCHTSSVAIFFCDENLL